MVEINTLCGMCLPAGRGLCGVKALVSNGRLIRVEGMAEHPNNQGVLCAKGLATIQLVYHPDRLKYPLKRVGERGSGRFERISWNEALETIVEKMNEAKEKYGAESVAFCRGTQGWWNLTYAHFYRLAKLFSTPNDGSVDHICHWPRAVGSRLTYGAFPTADYRRTACLIIWGAHPPYSNAPEQNPSLVEAMKVSSLMETMKQVRRTIVVDPRPTFLASRADIWLRVRPGTDGALALGMLNIIIDEKLYDRSFVDKWTIGFDELKELVKKYPPEKVAEITWIEKNKIVEAARTFATIKPGCILFGNGLDQHSNTLQTIRAICILRAVTGNLDIPGGELFPSALVPLSPYPVETLPQEAREKRLVDRFPIWKTSLPGDQGYLPAIIDAILTGKPYPITILITLGSNPALGIADSSRIREALKKVEFHAALEMFMTPTAKLADIVLPCCSSYEGYGFEARRYGEKGFITLRRPIIDPLYESRPDYEVAFELAKRLGFSKEFWDGDIKKAVEYHLTPLSIKFEDLEKASDGIYIPLPPFTYKKYEETDPQTGKKVGFNTPSGKVEIYSKTLESLGQDPLPDYREPAESPVSTPSLAEKYPLILTTGARLPVYHHSWLRNIPWLQEIEPHPRIEINPKTAAELRIDDGDRVMVESPRGSITARARLLPGLHPGVAAMAHGWPDPSNANTLTDHVNRDPIFGTTPLKSILCRIRKIQ